MRFLGTAIYINKNIWTIYTSIQSKKIMQKKYQMPIQLFLIMQKANAVIFTAETLIPSHYIIYLNKNDFFTINAILKNEFFSSKSTLIESSAIDTLSYHNFNEITNLINLNRVMPFYIYYIYSLKMRLTIILSNKNNSPIKSIERFYKNANWLERETAEMYGIFFKNKKDCRKLLLDYTKDENPLLKDFPTEGTNDVFYNFFEDQITFDYNNVTEL